jgi:prevent-host-death family protein
MAALHEEDRVRSFKENCLAIVSEVRAKREPVIITKHGKAMAKLIPVGTAVHEIYNFLAGKGAIPGDVLSSAIPPEEWDDLK